MAEHQLTCRTCGNQFTYHRRKAYCCRDCRPANKYRGLDHVASHCEECGVGLPVKRHPKMRYCSTACLRKKDRDRATINRGPVICLVCETEFRPKGADRTKCCGRECGLTFAAFKTAARAHGFKAIYAVNRLRCDCCKNMFSASSGTTKRKHCDTCIKQKRIGSYYVPVKGQNRNCEVCGTQFVARMNPDFSSSRWCSSNCYDEHRKKCPNYQEQQKTAKKVRRARKKGASRIDRISPAKVFERDLWRCGICGCKTHKSKRGTYHPRAPELDHIVALASGGSHTWDNVQCSCRECNGRKGAKSYGQMLLFPVA